MKDADYNKLVEENRRLHKLLEARSIAPHRIYALEGEGPNEFVIVAKAGDSTVVVRNLQDGREQIVELDEILETPEADYLLGAEKPVETVHVSIRLDRETDGAQILIHRNADSARVARDVWRRASFEPEKNDMIAAAWTDDKALVYTDEVIIED